MNAVAIPQLTLAMFESGDIDPEAFDHEAHIYVAWLYVCQQPLHLAIGNFTDALRRLTAQLGVPGKYHETISWFFMLLIAERRANLRSDSWMEFRHRNQDLFCRSSDVLDRYYSAERLWSDNARNSFVLPDRAVRQLS